MKQRSVLRMAWSRGSLVALLIAAVAPAAWAQAAKNFGTFSIGDVEIPLTGPGTWSVVAGALPPGMSLRADGAVWFSPPTAPGLVGVATTPGTYPFRLSDGTTTYDSTIKISALAVKDHWTLPDAFLGHVYSQQLTALNNVGSPVWTVAPWSNPMPPGVTLSPTGLLSGTPTLNGSYYNITVQLSDGIDTINRGINLDVSAIAIASSGPAEGVLPNATQNGAYSTTITASGGTGPYSFTSTNLPNGLVLDPSGTISGTVNTGSGNFSFTISATDSTIPDHVSYSKRMSLDVIAVPPTLPSISPQGFGGLFDDCTIGWPCSRGVSVNSGGTAPFSWTARGLPPGMSIRSGSGETSFWYAPGDAELWGTPTATGTYQIEVTVTDATGIVSATNTFPLYVSALLQTDVLSGGTFGDPYSSRIRVVGGVWPNYNISQTGGQLPVGLSFIPGSFDGHLLVTGTPQENGSFNTAFTFTDSAGDTLRFGNYFYIGSHTSTININSYYDLGTITQGISYFNQLSACCIPTPLAWTVYSGSLPTSMTLSSGGLLSGIPSVAGTYTFGLRAADSTNNLNFALRQFKVIVTPLSITSSFTLPYGNVGSFYSQTISVSGASGAVTWAVAQDSYLPPGLSVASPGPSTGSIGGTPTASGFYFFTLIATDAAGNLLPRSFRISIYPAGTNPPLNLQIGPNLGPTPLGQVSIQLAGASGGQPPYHFSLTPLAPAIPGMRVQDGQPLPTFFPSTVTAGYIGVVEFAGTYNTSLRVTDAASNVFDRAITLTVSPLALLSQTTLPKATVGIPYSFTLTPYPSSGTYSWSVASGSTLPNGLTLSSSGQISGTPMTATSSNNNVSITLMDLLASNRVTVNFRLVVNPFAITTGGGLPQATVGTFYSRTLASGCAGPCAWSIVSGNLPFGMSLNNSTGVLSGTPPGTSNGSFTVQVSGSNGIVQKVFSLQVVGSTPQSLSIANSPSFGYTTVGNGAAMALFAQGGTPPYSWALVAGALPPGVDVQGPGEMLSSTLGPGFTFLAGRTMQTGAYGFTLRVTDSATTPATVTRGFTWNITPLSLQYNNLPLAGTSLVYNQSYTCGCVATPGQPLLVMGGTGAYTWASNAPMPPGLTLDPATGIVSGTPSNTGFFNVPIQVTDSVGQLTINNVTFNIAGPTSTVVNFGASADFGVIQQGFGFTRDLSPSGGTGPYTITTAPSSTLPPGFRFETGNAVLANLSGSGYYLAGTPLATGAFTFTLRAQDSLGNIGVRTFALTVAPQTIFTNTSLPDASASQFYSQSIVAWNNAGVTNWAATSGSTLPSGLGLTTAGVLSGTPTTPGTYSFSLSATDTSTGLIVSPTFSLRVVTISIGGSQVLPTAVVGVPYTYTFAATGGGATKTWSAPGGIPGGFTLSSAGVLSGTATGASILNLFVTVSDGATSLTRRFTLSTRFSNPSVLSYPMAQTALADATVGQSFAFSLNPTGGVAPYTWSVASGSSLPPGLSLIPVSTLGAPMSSDFLPGSTLLAGAPALAGNYTFDLIVADAVSAQTRRTFTLHVASIAVLSGNLRNITTGTAYAQQLTALGGLPPYTFSISPISLTTDLLPSGLTMSSGGLLSGSTTSSGTYGFVLHAQDSAGGTFARGYNLTVNTPQGLRVTTTNPQDRPVGVSFGSQFLSATNTLGGGTYAWAVVGGALPPGIQLVAGAAGVGTTVLQGAPSAPGAYVYTLRATDTTTGNFADHTFTFTIGPMQVVAPPVQLLGSLVAGEVGASYSTTLKVAGTAAPYTFSESSFAPLPSWLTLSPTGVLSGTPTSTGTYVIRPLISDSAGNSMAGPSIVLVVTAAGTAAPLNSSPASNFLPGGSVGVPYNFALDGDALRLRFSGGVPPYSWSVTSGSLPPGLALLTGSNGVPNFLGGVPSTPGNYPFSLTVTDAIGQSVTIPRLEALSISELALTPDSLGPGLVGRPYSVMLTPSGGTATYAFALTSDSDLPPGVTLNVDGLLAGTPTHPGNFLMFVRVTDSVGRTLSKRYWVTMDNAAGEAPAVSLAPSAVHVDYVIGSPAPAGVSLSVNTTSGALPFTAAVLGIPGATLSSASGTTPGTTSLNVDVSSLTVGTYVGIIGVGSSQSVNRLDSVPLIVTIEPAPPCSYSLSPQSGNAPIVGGAGSFNVGASSLCSWSAAASDSWITITSAARGTGSGSVAYSIAANLGITPRSGSITVNGQAYTITQFGTTCSFAINPLNLTPTAAGGTAFIAIDASNATCAWTATGLSATPSRGTGSGGVTVTVPPNPTASPQTLTAVIAGQTLRVNQAGTACTVGLNTYTTSSPAGGGSGTVTVTVPTGCGYSTVPGPSWISVISGGSGTGSGTLVYAVDPNSTTTPRSGTLTIGGQSFLVQQDGLACSVTVDTSGLGSPFGSSGGSGAIGITTNGPSCSWTASSAQSWASVVPTSGTGNGTVFVSVTANATLAPRSTTLAIGGQTVGISQSEIACSYALRSATGAVPASGGSGSVGVAAPAACAWTATSNNPDWVSITSSGSGGSSDVQFVALPNPSSIPRTGNLTIAGQTYTVSEAGAACFYNLTPTGTTAASTGTTDSFAFSTTTAGCSPSAVSYAGWITVGTSFSGTSGTVNYSVMANPTTLSRASAIQVGDQIFTVSQSGGACGYSLNAYGALFGQSGGSGKVLGSPTGSGCDPSRTIGTDQPTIVTLGTLSGPLLSIFTQPYSVTPFSSLTVAVRRATITFGGQIFTVKQTSW